MEAQETTAQTEATPADSTPTPNEPVQEAKQEEEKSGNEQQKTEEPKTERYSRQHRVLLKKEAELRRRDEEAQAKLTQEREALEKQRQELAQYEQYKQWDEQLAQNNPWAFLQAKGYDLFKLQKMAAEYQTDPNVVVRHAADQLRKEMDEKYSAKFEALEKQREEQENAAFDAALAQKQEHITKEIDHFLQANSDKYELVASLENPPLEVLTVIWEAYQQSNGQRALTYEQAADAYEKVLEDEELKGNKLFRTSKAKKLLLESESSDVVKQDRKKQAASPRERSKSTARASQSQSQPRTLSNKMASVTTPENQGKESFEERKKRLSQELANKTWKPKSEHVTQQRQNYAR